jgi:hypothetical protein
VGIDVNAATITALCTGIAGIVVAVTALVKVLMHTHQPPH